MLESHWCVCVLHAHTYHEYATAVAVNGAVCEFNQLLFLFR